MLIVPETIVSHDPSRPRSSSTTWRAFSRTRRLRLSAGGDTRWWRSSLRGYQKGKQWTGSQGSCMHYVAKIKPRVCVMGKAMKNLVVWAVLIMTCIPGSNDHQPTSLPIYNTSCIHIQCPFLYLGCCRLVLQQLPLTPPSHPETHREILLYASAMTGVLLNRGIH